MYTRKLRVQDGPFVDHATVTWAAGRSIPDIEGLGPDSVSDYTDSDVLRVGEAI